MEVERISLKGDIETRELERGRGLFAGETFFFCWSELEGSNHDKFEKNNHGQRKMVERKKGEKFVFWGDISFFFAGLSWI